MAVFPSQGHMWHYISSLFLSYRSPPCLRFPCCCSVSLQLKSRQGSGQGAGQLGENCKLQWIANRLSSLWGGRGSLEVCNPLKKRQLGIGMVGIMGQWPRSRVGCLLARGLPCNLSQCRCGVDSMGMVLNHMRAKQQLTAAFKRLENFNSCFWSSVTCKLPEGPLGTHKVTSSEYCIYLAWAKVYVSE